LSEAVKRLWDEVHNDEQQERFNDAGKTYEQTAGHLVFGNVFPVSYDEIGKCLGFSQLGIGLPPVKRNLCGVTLVRL
jgi:hypothetical protein